MIAAGFLLQAITGVLIAFKPEIYRTSFGTPVALAGRRQAEADVDRVVALAGAALPEHVLERVIFPRVPGDPWLVRLRRPGASLPGFVAVEPVSLQVRHAGSVWHFPLELAVLWHHDLLVGAAGQWVQAMLGTGVLTMAVTGFILWAPRGSSRRSFKVRWGASPRLLIPDVHRVTGIFVAPLLAIAAITGAFIALRPWILPAEQIGFQTLRPARVPTDMRVRQPERMVLGDVARKARSDPSRHAIREIRVNGREGRTVRVLLYDARAGRPRAIDQVWIDRANGDVIAYDSWWKKSATTRLADWALPIHTGEVGRVPGRVLVAATGVAALGSLCTGLTVWYQRRKPPRL